MIMKRLMAISTTLLLLMSCFAGCGQKKEEVEIPENYLYTEIGLDGEIRYVTAPPTEPPVTMGETTEETTEPEPVEIDVFEQAEITLNENSAYPNTIAISIESTNPEIASHIYSIDVTYADLEKIEYTISVNEAYETFAYYLEQNNYVVAETSKTFVVETSDLKTLLISDELLTDENVQALNDMAEEYREEEFVPIVSYAVVPNEGMTIDALLGSSDNYIFTSNQFDNPEYYFYTIYQCDRGYYEVGAAPRFDENQQLIVDETRFLTSGSYYNTREEAQAAIDEMMSRVQNVDNTHVVTIEYDEGQPTT